MNKHKSVEDLFTYEESHFYDRGYIIYFNVTLKKDFGKFKAGTTHPEVHIDGASIYFATPGIISYNMNNKFQLKYAALDTYPEQ